MPVFDDVKKALAALDKGSELVSVLETNITELVTAEQNKGKEEKGQANREAEGLRKRLKRFEETFGLDSKADDFDSKLTETKAKLTAPPASGKESDIKTHPEFLALNEKLTAFEKNQKERDDREKLNREKLVEKTRRTAALEGLTKLKVHEKALTDAVDLVSRKIKVRDDDSVFVEDDKGNPMTVEAYVAAYVKDRPHIVENSQGPGGGGGPGGGEGRPNDKPDNIAERTKALRERQAQFSPII